MAILIKDPETDELIRDLARRTGETLMEAVRKAAELRLASLPERKGRIDRDKLREAQAYFNALPRAGESRTDDEVIGYNDQGHFD